MTKGIIYIMTTAVSGLIKIGQTGNTNYKERMRQLELNGYYNVAYLKQYFAIELDDYVEKEKLLHEVFTKHRVGSSELFALDVELLKQLLLSFEGRVVYPSLLDTTQKEKEFEQITKIRKKGELFSFYKKGLKNGDQITFCEDSTKLVKVYSEREIEIEGQVWKLSPFVYDYFKQVNKLNNSGAYQGSAYFEYGGVRLNKLVDANS